MNRGDLPRPSSFDALSTAQAWDEGAEAWDDFVQSGGDYYRLEVHGPGLLDACGDVRGLKVLDLGCGQGYLARELALKGANVVGVDLSEKQIENARRHEQSEPLGIEYFAMDAALVSHKWPTEAFDLVAGCMSLHDMPEPTKVLQSVRKVLKHGGRFVFSIPHPCTDTPFRQWERDENGNKVCLKIDRYFDTGPGVTRWHMERLKYYWETPNWHFTLTEISKFISDGGFLIRRMYEPRPTKEQVEAIPDLDDCYRVPYFLVFDLVALE